MPVDGRLADVVRMRKVHACGGWEWNVVRLGADIGLVCRTCSRRVLLPRRQFERGYVVRGFVNFHYLWPVNQPYWIHKLEFLNEMGKMLTPFPAGFYCLIVQKYELGAVRPWLSAAREPWTVCEASMPMSQTTYKATTHD